MDISSTFKNGVALGVGLAGIIIGETVKNSEIVANAPDVVRESLVNFFNPIFVTYIGLTLTAYKDNITSIDVLNWPAVSTLIYIAIEYGQKLGIAPGGFEKYDIPAYILGGVTAYLTASRLNKK